MNAAGLRSEFPGLDGTVYLNAGTCGPVPRASLAAAADVAERGAREGRTHAYYAAMLELRERQRRAYAQRLGADPGDVALTLSTSDGIARVLRGLDLGAGDEVLTAPDEHPGLLAPLADLRARHGVAIRLAPFADLADAVGAKTTLVACSHVSWVTGAMRPAGLASLDVPVLLDGAQGVGAVALDAPALGCDFYAGSGQKWLCGPLGTGMLWVASHWRGRLAPASVTPVNLADFTSGIDSPLHDDARRYDAPAVAPECAAAAVAAHDVLAGHGWEAVHERAIGLAGRLAEDLAARGRRVAARDATTLVSWEDATPEATRERLAGEHRILVRSLPGSPFLRASVGAWNDESDLERLIAALELTSPPPANRA